MYNRSGQDPNVTLELSARYAHATLAIRSNATPANVKRHARRRRGDSASSVSIGHNNTAMTMLTGNDPQAAMTSRVESPPQPNVIAAAHAALQIAEAISAGRDQCVNRLAI